MVRGNKFKPTGRKPASAAATMASVAADTTAGPHKQLGHRRKGDSQSTERQEHPAANAASPALQHEHAAGATAAPQHGRAEGKGRIRQRSGPPRRAEGGLAQDATVSNAKHSRKRRRVGPDSATAAVAEPTPASTAAHRGGAQAAAVGGLEQSQHGRKQRRMGGSSLKQAVTGASSPAAVSPSAAHQAEQQQKQHAGAQRQHVRKKRRLWAGSGTKGGAATVTIHGVDVRTTVAQPPKGAPSPHANGYFMANVLNVSRGCY